MSALIRSRAPVRINFAGGGTDVEPYVSDYGSYILSAAVKLYCRATCDTGYKPKTVIETMLSEIAGSPIKIMTDIYPASGLGSSASCFVAGLKFIFPQLQKKQLAQLAFYLERKVMKIAGGNQDQYCAAYGGILFIISEGNKVEVNQLAIPSKLAQYLVLIYTGARVADGKDIIEDQSARSNIKELHHQKQLAKEMRDSILKPDYISFGKLLDEAWLTKRKLSSLVSTPAIDELHDKCLTMGAVGSCIMGAGSGGYMLAMEHPEREGELRQNLVTANISYWNIEFDTEGVCLAGGEQ